MTVIYDQRDDEAAAPWAPQLSRPNAPQASREQVERAAEMLAGASRPVVLAGTGVDRSGANDALLAIVELLGCPVITTMSGRSTVPTDHPHTGLVAL